MLSSQNGQFSYVVVDDWIDSIHRFERVTGANDSIERPTFDLYDEYLVRLVSMDIEPGVIKIGSTTYNDCATFDNTQIEDISYTVISSKWQVREALGEAWADVAGQTRTDNQLCPYDPPDGDERDHRLVFEVTIDGTTGALLK